MTQDWNKGIKHISYNHLNLPTRVEFATQDGNEKSISYLYNALGVKLEKTVKHHPFLLQNTQYLNGFQYVDGSLQFFPTAEGYVNVTDNTKFNYVYNYTDHLGNIRLSYSQPKEGYPAEKVEENHYYPFGMKHLNYGTDKNNYRTDEEGGIFAVLKPVERNKNQYKYNGKEFQDELGLNLYAYGYRHYDPAIARWTTMDPLLNDLDATFDENDADEEDEEEVYQALITKLENGGGVFNPDNLNPYGYGYNNPIIFDDPDGRCPICIIAILLLAAEPAMAPTHDPKDGQRMADAKSAKVEWMTNAIPIGSVTNGTAGTILRATVKNEAKGQVKKVVEKTFQTYTKTNKKTGETYSGRTSGKGTPTENVAKRDKTHHKNKEGYGPAKLDKSSKSKDAIRGREQKLIDKNGKAKSEGGTSGNSVRGVSPTNPNAKKYDKAAKKEFGD